MIIAQLEHKIHLLSACSSEEEEKSVFDWSSHVSRRRMRRRRRGKTVHRPKVNIKQTLTSIHCHFEVYRRCDFVHIHWTDHRMSIIVSELLIRHLWMYEHTHTPIPSNQIDHGLHRMFSVGSCAREKARLFIVVFFSLLLGARFFSFLCIAGSYSVTAQMCSKRVAARERERERERGKKTQQTRRRWRR